MSNVIKINFKKIYLFQKEKHSGNYTNPLKSFLYFLKHQGIKGIIDFSYSWNNDSLHAEMTIKDNFLLDAVPTSFIKDRENNLREFIETLKNPYLSQLVKSLGDLDQKINTLSSEKIKLVSLTKSLLSSSDYIFFVEPETSLTTDHLNLFKEAMKFEVTNYSRVIMIYPYEPDIWVDLATHFVTRNDESIFEDRLNPLLREQTLPKENEHSVGLKKVS